jgi:hypothetical protein
MKLSDFSLEALKPFVTGDDSPAPYMSGPDMIKFFENLLRLEIFPNYDESMVANMQLLLLMVAYLQYTTLLFETHKMYLIINLQ